MADSQHDLLIIYTTKNGRTGSMVEPIRQGIIDGGASAAIRTVQEVQWDEMLAAKGIIVGTPVRFGDVDWQIKQLFDITALQDYPGPLSGKVGGAFTGGRQAGRRRGAGPTQYASHTVEPRHGNPGKRSFGPLRSVCPARVVTRRSRISLQRLGSTLGGPGAAAVR